MQRLLNKSIFYEWISTEVLPSKKNGCHSMFIDENFYMHFRVYQIHEKYSFLTY